MKNFKVGDTWQGVSHADMINKVLGTNYKAWMKASVPLSQFGKEGIAWFVFMNDTEHGISDTKFKNSLSENGKVIIEKCVTDDIKSARSKINLGTDFAKRLAFQLDPSNTGNRYKCKFVGYFERCDFDNKTLTRKYKRISETFSL